MNDSNVPSTSAGSDADAPASKKSKLDEPKSAQPSSPDVAVVGPRNFAQGGVHKGTLVVHIGDWNAFKQAPEAGVSSEPQIQGGIRFTLEAFADNRWLCVCVRAAHPAEHQEWHSKAALYIRLPRTPRSERMFHVTIFDNKYKDSCELEVDTLDNVSRLYVRDNALTLKMDITTVDCPVTDGSRGHKLRYHDVAFVFGDRRVYCSKGFFEGMFFGDFADRNKDEVELPTVTIEEFGLFLEAIAPVPVSLESDTALSSLRMANRFLAHELENRCVEYLMRFKEVPFVEQLEVADELNMTHYRDLLIDTATNAELSEAAKSEYEAVFSTQTWMKMYLKYRELQPPT